MARILIAVIAVFLCHSNVLQAQNDPGFLGEALGEQVNTEHDELSPRIDPEGNVMYFVRTGHPRNIGGQDIWFSKLLADGSWSTAQPAPEPLNNDRHNAVGGITAGGDVLLLANTYGDTPSPGIAIARLENGEWGEPRKLLSMQQLGVAINYFGFSVSDDYSAMFISMSRQNDPKGKEDLYVSLRGIDGEWDFPLALGEPVNSAGSEISPFLSADQQMLFFASDGHGSGNMDIYMSRRLGEGWTDWSEPESLGRVVNTMGFEGHFVIDPAGETAYFTSDQAISGKGDIYRIPVKDIPLLAPPVEASSQDTLRIFAKQNTPLPVSFESFGIGAKQVPLVTTRSLDGNGKLLAREQAPNYVYRPAPDFFGTEHLMLTLCDPPHSDDCQQVVVVAEVEPVVAPQPPQFVTVRTRTPRNTPVKLELGGRTPEMVDLKRSNAGRDAPQGTVSLNRETGGEHLFYRPDPDFLGRDTIDLYRFCDKGDPRECLLARVIVDVFEDAVAVIDSPPKPIEPAGDVLIYGKTLDEKTGEPLGAEVSFYELPSGNLLGTIKSDDKTGEYQLRLPAGVQYSVAAKEKYHFDASTLVPASAKDKIERDLEMEPLPTEVGSVFTLENIYFDLDKSTLKPESREELTRLYGFLKANPTVRIRIEGHTDSWASDEYNVTLSQNRAQAVVNYLKYKGVMGHRLEAKGFGEAVPIATNDTDEGRALNRRVEFRILSK